MKGVIFDCDGTLVDTEMSHFQAWLYAFEKQGCVFNIEDYFHCVGIPTDHAVKLLSNKMTIPNEQQLKKDKHAFFRSSIEKGVAPLEDTYSFLLKLVKEQKNFGYKLAIASGAPKEEILLYLKHLKIDSCFDVVLSGRDDLHHYSDPNGVNKPSPYIYLEAAKQLGLDPKDCVAIEDSCTGVTASARAGCVTVAIPTFYSQQHDFSAAHLIVPSLKDYSVSQFLKELSLF